MSTIRGFKHADVEPVARMFMRIYRHSDAAAPAHLIDYFRLHFVDAPVCDSEVPSLVHVEDDETISGFLGVNVITMLRGAKSHRAAICGTFMVESPEKRPMAAARLMKTLMEGKQDLTLSETTSEKTSRMVTRLGAAILPQYSLDWFRVIRPTGLLVETASQKLPPARWLSPAAKGVDGLLRGRGRESDLRWSMVGESALPTKGFELAEIDVSKFVEHLERFTRQYDIRPDFAGDGFAHVIGEGLEKPDYGKPVVAEINARGGKPVGAVFYHVRPGATAHVLQVLAQPGQEGAVLDALVRDAAERGAVALRGRLQPALLEPMLVRRIALLPIASSIVQSRTPAFVNAFTESKGFFNGLVSEKWSRFYGGSL